VLLAKGYRVARVDQAETALGLDRRARAGGATAEDTRVIRRSVTEILTPGTLQDPGMAGSAQAPRVVAVWEGEGRVFGVCVVECATHTITLGSFRDDARLSHLETLLLQAAPREALLCRGACSPAAAAMVRAHVPVRSLVHMRPPGDDFWDPERARVTLEGAFDTTRVPAVLQTAAVGEGDRAALWAAGGALAYLDELGVLAGVLTAVKLLPFDALPAGQVGLDGSTLANLDILGSGPTSLLSLIDRTVTPQGSRLMRQWCSAPLADPDRIADRLIAIDVLRANPEWTKQLRGEFKHVPDLERLAALCAVGVCSVAKLALLALGLQRAWETLAARFVCNTALRLPGSKSCPYDGASPLLEEAGALSASGGAAIAERLLNAVPSWAAVKESQLLQPVPGMDSEADDLRAAIESVNQRLEVVLTQARVAMGTHDVAFLTLGKTRNLLDAPLAVRARAVKGGYVLANSTKTRDRFSCRAAEELVEELAELEDRLHLRRQAFLVQLQKSVASMIPEIGQVSDAVARLDALEGLAAFVDAFPGALCRPHVMPRGGRQAYLEATDLRHPAALQSGTGAEQHVGNDVMMGGSSPSCLLITGPNMGGKSTLLRAVCLNAVLAHVGCWVPCASFRMTAMDRVFTRIGARDDIAAGQSTFMREMLETAAVLHHATSDSLVVLDELGRGTSTHDGYAIAHAVLRELEERLACRALFSTHHLHLAEEFRRSVRVQARMMSFHIAEEGQKLVFLYRLVLGVTPSSFGMNVARIAGLPEAVVARAEQLAADMQAFASNVLHMRFADTVRKLQ
jgi:DNA mismatch repair protein MSH6